MNAHNNPITGNIKTPNPIVSLQLIGLPIEFVYVNPLKIPYVDLGIASLSAYLKNRGFQTELIDFTFNSDIKKAIRRLKRYNPDIVCFSSRSGEFKNIVKTAETFRKHHKALHICGGIHPTIAPDEVISHSCFDAIGIGEGEVALYDLVEKNENGKDYYDTKGFWFKQYFICTMDSGW